MTFATETTGNRGWNRTIWVEIDGVQPLLTHEALSPSSLIGSTRTQKACIPYDGFQFGETRLDLSALRQTGSTCTVDLLDVDGTLGLIFAPRTRRLAWVIGAPISKTATTIRVNTISALPASGTVYINGETITYTGTSIVSGTESLTGCTRGAYGSTAQAHWGNTDAGAGVYVVPVVWRGRKARIKAAYIDSSGSIGSSSNDVQTLMTVRFAEPPQHLGNGRWRLKFEELSASYGAHVCYLGQRPIKMPGDQLAPKITTWTNAITSEVQNVWEFEFEAFSEELNLFSHAINQTVQVLAETQNGIELFNGFISGTKLYLKEDGRFLLSALALGAMGLQVAMPIVTRLQHVAYLTGNPATIVLQLLLSNLGNGTNSATYDVLPGKDRTAYAKESWRLGANLTSSDVDIASFEGFKTSDKVWSFILCESLTVSDLLTEFCRVENAFWFVSNTGKITVKRLAEANEVTAATSSTIVNDAVVEVTQVESVELDQQRILNGYLVKANWNPTTERYTWQNLVVDWEFIDQFPDATEVKEWASKFLAVSSTEAGLFDYFKRVNPMDPEAIVRMCRKVQQSTTRPRAYVTLRCAWSVSMHNVGDIVKLDRSILPDLTVVNGIIGVINNPALIVGKEIDPLAPLVTFRFMLLDPAFRFAPFAKVSSNVSSGTVQVHTNDPALTVEGTTADITKLFLPGWVVQIVDVSASTSEQLTISSLTSNTITFTTAPSFTPTDGDLIFLKANSANNAATNFYGLSGLDYAWQIAVGETGTLTRWV